MISVQQKKVVDERMTIQLGWGKGQFGDLASARGRKGLPSTDSRLPEATMRLSLNGRIC